MKTSFRLVAVCLMLAGFFALTARGELAVEGQLNGAMLNLRWSGEGNLFLIEHSDSLTAPAWRQAGVTVATNVNLDTCGNVGFYRVAAIEAPLDTADYDQDRPAMAQFYGANPTAYWVDHGLPVGTRLAIMRTALGVGRWDAMADLAPAFQQMNLMNALQQGTLPAEVIQRLNQKLMAGHPPPFAYLEMNLDLVAESDALFFGGQPNAPRRAEIRNLIQASFQVAFSVPALAPFAPAPSKSGTNLPAEQRRTYAGVHGMNNFNGPLLSCVTTNVAPPGGGGGNVVTNWAAIDSADHWTTTYNAACVAAAVGASAVKLRMMPPSMDCAAWNSLGQQLSATPGTPGAPAGSWSSWYQARGYGCTIAKDGPLESAREEARKAHNRGCDVLLHYIPDGGGQSHIEMVAGFPPDTLGESVSTLSWGTVANVTVIFGRFFSKTDAGRYGANSFLSRSGSAVFYYYCPR